MKVKFFLFFLSCLTFFILLDIITNLFYGLPKVKILDEISQNTYDAELGIYKKFFTKEKNKETNEIEYVSRRIINRSRFSVKKKANTKIIFIIGDSIAEQFEKSWENLELQLKNYVPGYNFEVINCGRGEFESERIFLIFKEIINYEPDLILLLMGNNIFVCSPRKKFNKITLFLYEHSWSYFLLNNALSKIKEIKKNVLNNYHYFLLYEKNLNKMLEISRNYKIPLILFTIPLNMRDFIEEELPLNNKDFFIAKLKLEKGEIIQAKNILKKLEKEQKNSIIISFYLGKCYEYLKNYETARKYYYKSLFFYKRQLFYNKMLATKFKDKKIKGLVIIDLIKIFENVSPNGITGANIFYDNCHWYQSWNELINYEIIKNIYFHNKENNDNIITNANEWNPNFSSFNINSIIKKINDDKKKMIGFNLLSQTHISYHFVKNNINDKKYSNLYSLLLSYIRMWYQTVDSKELEKINKLKKTYILNFKDFPGDNTKETIKKLSHSWYFLLSQIGKILRENKNYTLALKYFNESLRLNNKNIYAYLLRGLTYYNLKNFDKAKTDWIKVIEINPDFKWLLELL